MRKLILTICLCGFALASFAQEEKVSLSKPVSENFKAYTTGLSLLQFGYETSSPTALIEAARIIASVPVAPGNFECLDNDKVEGKKDQKISFDPRKILEDALAMAGNDKTLKNLAQDVMKSLDAPKKRYAVGGPYTLEGSVSKQSSKSYTCKFYGGEVAEVGVVGDGDNDLDLYVYDANGNLVASDTDYIDTCVARWVPAWTGTFTIKIVNRGKYVYSDFILLIP